MSFQSYTFLFLLLPVAVAGWWLLNWRGHGKLAQGFLLLVSLAFYGKARLAFLPILLGSILFNFGVGKGLQTFARYQKGLLALGLLGNLGLLGYFKYANFFLENVNRVLGTSLGALTLLLPLGISFFTFQQIAYLMDCYRGDKSNYTLLEYACFVSFFPCVTSGPIAFHDEVIPQLRAANGHGPTAQTIAEGLWLFSLGMWKKVLLAQAFGGGADWGYNNIPALNSTTALAVVLSYTLQLYFDFRGGLHGIAMVADRLLGSRLEKVHPALSWAVTFAYVNLCWIFFRADSIHQALSMGKAIARCNFGALSDQFTDNFQLALPAWIGREMGITLPRLALLMFLAFTAFALVFCLQEKPVKNRKFVMTGKKGVLAGVLLFWSIISLGTVTQFIYSNF